MPCSWRWRAPTCLRAGKLNLRSRRLIPFRGLPYQKDYDAIVDVWIGERTARFALEYERTLKSARQYEHIRTALEAEQQIEFILYLTSGMEILVHLLHEFQSVRKQLAFANARSFEQQQLDTVVTGRDGTAIKFRDLLK